jgi:hypothetical protein
MSRIYARREDTGEDILVEIKCDWCSATEDEATHWAIEKRAALFTHNDTGER